MASFVNLLITQYLNPRKMYIWCFLLVCLLLSGVYYVYNNNTVLSKTNIPNNGSTENVQILYFTVDWCPHCKKAKTPWNDFKNGYNNKKIKNTTVQCIEYNVTEKTETDADFQKYKTAQAMTEKYKIDSFPTIKMVRGTQIIDFDAKISTFALEKFVDDMV